MNRNWVCMPPNGHKVSRDGIGKAEGIRRKSSTYHSLRHQAFWHHNEDETKKKRSSLESDESELY